MIRSFCNSARKYSKKNLLFVFLLLSLGSTAQIDFTSGRTGKLWYGQSFNETRGLDVTVLSSSLHLSSVTLSQFTIRSDSGMIGLRIYNSTSRTLLLRVDSIRLRSEEASITIPISFTLDSASSYRICFYLHTFPDTAKGSCSLYDQTSFPYTESTNHLIINSVHAYPDDAFPENPNFGIPFIKLAYQPPLAIGAFKKSALIQIYPNPFSDRATLSANYDLNNATLNLYNMMGQMVRQLNHLQGNEMQLYRHELPAGVYFFHLIENGELIAKDRIVISN